MLRFEPIDLVHAHLCVRFAEDTERCSFGSLAGFYGSDGQGAQRFIERIREKLDKDPRSCLHVWQENEIVGQLHLSQFGDEPIGYINFFYVAPDWRGKGVATQINNYAMSCFQQRGFSLARLSVAIDNERAVAFYLKQGWKDVGARKDKPGVHNMEKSCGSSFS